MLIRTRVRESGQEIVINTAQVICVVDSGGFAAVTLPMLHMSNGWGGSTKITLDESYTEFCTRVGVV